MKKVIHNLFPCLIILTVVSGSDMRIGALGGNPGFWPEDDQNIYMFPATINNFNLAQIRGISSSGDGGDYYEGSSDEENDNASAVFLWGDNTKYGFFMDGQDNLVKFGYGDGTWGLLVGLDMDNIESTDSVTVWIENPEDYYSGGSWETSAVTTKASGMDVNAAFGMNMGFGELGVGFNMSSSDNDNDNDDDDPSLMSIGANLRREQALWEFSHLLASFNLISASMGDAEATNIGLSLNLFRHWDINTDTDLLFAIGFGFSSLTENSGLPDAKDVKTMNITLPSYTFGVETNLLDWATVRAGVNNDHTLRNSVDNGSTTSSSMGDGDFALAFGLGLEYGGFTLDIDLNPGFFTNPVNHITGNNLLSPLASQATITYSW